MTPELTNEKRRKVKKCLYCGDGLYHNAAGRRFCSQVCRELFNEAEQYRVKKKAYQPINNILRELSEYNRGNSKRLSYGQYVAQSTGKRKR